MKILSTLFYQTSRRRSRTADRQDSVVRWPTKHQNEAVVLLTDKIVCTLPFQTSIEARVASGMNILSTMFYQTSKRGSRTANRQDSVHAVLPNN